MKNTFKRIIAILIAGTMLLSVAACSKVSDGEQSAEGKEIVNAADGENVVSNENAEAIRAEIKQKAADIIATLEVGKTYDEMPITAKKLGVERFSVEETPLNADGEVCTEEDGKSSTPSVRKSYADVSDKENMICTMQGRYGYSKVTYWLVGNDQTTTQIYMQNGNGFDIVTKEVWGDLNVIRRDGANPVPTTDFINYLGYDVCIFACNRHNYLSELEFTYLGTEAIDGYEETLVFEAVNGTGYHRFNIDTETGFCVKYHHNCGIEALNDGIDYYTYYSKVTIEPDEQTPELE